MGTESPEDAGEVADGISRTWRLLWRMRECRVLETALMGREGEGRGELVSHGYM